MTDLSIFSLLLASNIGVFILFLVFPKRKITKKIKGSFSATLLIIYFSWRYFETIPEGGSATVKHLTWMYFYLFVEILSIVDLLQNLIFQVSTGFKIQKNSESMCGDKGKSVDLLIPTYNESVSLLRRTILCAKEIEWEDITINVLDDGGRPEVRDLCIELDVNYFSRSKNSGAKAGNMNFAIQFLKGDFVAILDADFMAFSHFVKSAVPYFDDVNVGCVQFPQVFYNPDPTQINTAEYREFQDEQWHWYHHVLPTRDRLNLATSCGSCSVVRRASLREIGDKFPEDTITEDFDMSLRMLEQGIITRYVDKTVAIGLHAQSVMEFFKQRKRWAVGNIAAQKKSLFRRGQLKIYHKILLFEWRSLSLIARLFTLFAPCSVLLFDIWPLEVNSIFEYLIFTMPFIYVISRSEILLFGNSIKNILLHQARSIGLSIALGSELFKSIAFSTKIGFDVTSKAQSEIIRQSIHQRFMMLSLMLSILSLGFGFVKFFQNENPDKLLVPIVWQSMNLLLVYFSVRMFTDKAYHRKTERFVPKGRVLCDFRSTKCDVWSEGVIIDISEGGVSILSTNKIEDLEVELIFNNIKIFGKTLRQTQDDCGNTICRIQFAPAQVLNDDLVKFIYTGQFIPEMLKTRRLNDTEAS